MLAEAQVLDTVEVQGDVLMWRAYNSEVLFGAQAEN